MSDHKYVMFCRCDCLRSSGKGFFHSLFLHLNFLRKLHTYISTWMRCGAGMGKTLFAHERRRCYESGILPSSSTIRNITTHYNGQVWAAPLSRSSSDLLCIAEPAYVRGITLTITMTYFLLQVLTITVTMSVSRIATRVTACKHCIFRYTFSAPLSICMLNERTSTCHLEAFIGFFNHLIFCKKISCQFVWVEFDRFLKCIKNKI